MAYYAAGAVGGALGGWIITNYNRKSGRFVVGTGFITGGIVGVVSVALMQYTSYGDTNSFIKPLVGGALGAAVAGLVLPRLTMLGSMT